MYLKRIEAQGFKSFANKTVLELDPGIMGIVGPNGSGKSNIADAVRWVLGEQSAKQLRGGSMQDIIFAGTASRKPQSYAYVTLTIDNNDHALALDFDEIVVTRRVYRSGESEYLINGNACRLRDINELFYDTGIGKEGYSIISQGQIDKILSTKPEDRRELFDEAAGIVKFKKRKDISLKKLEQEQNNLLRVSDVLGELEKQVGPIKEQAEVAKKYLALREELKTYEVGAFHRESEELKKKLDGVNEKLTVASAEFEEASKASEEMRSKYDDASNKRNFLDKQIEEDREALSAINLEKENLDGRIKVLDEQVGTLKAAEKELKERLAVLDNKYLGIAKDKDTFTEEKGGLNDKLDAAYDAIEKSEQDIEDQEDKIRIKEHELEVKQNTILTDIKDSAGLSADSTGINVKLEDANSRKEAISSAISELEKSINAIKEDEENTNKMLATFKSDISNKEQTFNSVNIDIENLERKLKSKDEEVSKAVTDLNVSKSRLEHLKNMAERYDGYGESIKHVMNAKKSNVAIKGVVADIIKVDKKYEMAIETALGGKIQNVVTTDEASAKEMVEFLKKGKLGRVTFLPMDAVKGSDLQEKDALNENGIIDTANHLVSFDPQYEGVVDRLLGKTLVADSITNALSVAKKYKYKLHIVTLEGEYLAPGGSITGGAFKNSSNLLSRKREIEALGKEIDKLTEDGISLRNERDEINNKITEKRNEASRLQNEVQELKVKEAASIAGLENIIAEKARLDEEKSARNNEQQELLLLITELMNKVQDSQQAAMQAEKAEEESKKAAEELIADIEAERTKLKEMQDAYTVLKLEYSKLEERDNFLVENINRINQELEQIDDEKRELLVKSDPEGLIELAKEREKEKLVAKTQELVKNAAELTEKLSEATTARDNFSSEQQKLLDERDESVAKSASLDKEVLRLTNQKERITEQIDAQVAYLWNEYEMTPIEAEALRYEGEETLSQMRKIISDRKSQIKELGPVNINAIEDEKEIGERYEFLSAQHEDLVKARDSILEVIKDLEEGMRKQFEEKFALIRDEFDIVFKDLFGGGKGTLELLPEADGDVLKAGISIIAQPPGKKLQNMMQLSGGEKALTAIALIFAIQNLKPSPFCLLDEIEAALDETNVARFAGYLDKLKKNTQLITITHRRGTMEAADKLYGITMQEKGISTIVSVNFTDAAKEFGEDD